MQTNVIKQYKNIKMKKKKLIFILALFAALWYSCYDDLPGSWKHKQEDTVIFYVLESYEVYLAGQQAA